MASNVSSRFKKSRKIKARGKSSVNRKYNNNKNKEESFFVTYLKVSSTFLFCIVFVYGLYIIYATLSPIPNAQDFISEKVWKAYVGENDGGLMKGQVNHTFNVFPRFKHDETIMSDPWSIAETYLNNITNPSIKMKKFIKTASQLRDDFSSRYGGKNSAREVLKRGLYLFESDGNGALSGNIAKLASRILRTQKKGEPFIISFAGTSATSGRGNFHNDSFPHVLEETLRGQFLQLGIELKVKNSAISDISSFPYGWCLKNFMGFDADVVSWDSSLSGRRESSEGFEAYLRNAITLNQSPMLIVREAMSTTKRKQVIQRYVDMGVINDSVLIDTNAAVEPFINLNNDIMPHGFLEWTKFGSPDGAPDKIIKTNLSFKQHQLIGWLLSIHFLSAMELVASSILGGNKVNVDLSSEKSSKYYELPDPISSSVNSEDKYGVNSLLFGTPFEDKSTGKRMWSMNPIYCRTTFEPIISGDLYDIIVSGYDERDLDLMHPKGPMLYNKAWILDLERSEKISTRKHDQYKLGYKDKKKALYGVTPSGNLTFFIPYQLDENLSKHSKNTDQQENRITKGKKPNELFQNIVICGINEYHSPKQCNMERDVQFLVGGVISDSHYINAVGAAYRGHPLCVTVEIPSNSSLSTESATNQPFEKGVGNRKKQTKSVPGLSLKISVTGQILWDDGPCSVSHIIWEQFRVPEINA